MGKALEKLAAKLKLRQDQNALRKLQISNGLIDFASNDYLGFSSTKAIQKEVDRVYSKSNKNLGSTGSRLLSGNYSFVEELEKELAEYYHSEASILFNSGYAANTALLQSIPQRGDTIIYDELIHASLKEGARLSFADKYSFKHNDLQDLERKIKKSTGEVFIVIESIYSMDGDESDLLEILKISNQYNCNVILDEAHSTGVIGDEGKGVAIKNGVENKVFARLHTFGKGMGCHGGLVVGNKILIDYLINYALSFIYTTALPLHSSIVIKCVHNYLENNTHLVRELKEKIDLFDNSIIERDRLIKSHGPIKAIRISGNDQVKKIASIIQQNGFDVRPILSPTVKAGEERLRICIHNFNTKEEILGLCKAINNNL